MNKTTFLVKIYYFFFQISGMVFRLAFTPCLVETLTVAVASHFLLDFEWMWGFMLGFVLGKKHALK